MASEMTSTYVPSRLPRARKPTHTYSLTVNGDSVHLVTSASPCTIVARSSSVPPTPASCDALQSYSLTYPSIPRFHLPCLPVPRAPRAANIYAYRPTAADRDKERKRRVLRAAAIEDARKEREKDERRRNTMLGITTPRKSTRKGKGKGKAAASIHGATVLPEQPAVIVETGGRKTQGATKAKAKAVQSTTVWSTSIGPTPSSTPFPVLSLPVEIPSSTNKSRRKPQPKVNSRPTERLTTRSLARLKATSVVGESEVGILSVGSSEVGCDEAMDVDVETHNKDASRRSSVSVESVTRPQDGVQRSKRQAVENSLIEKTGTSSALLAGPRSPSGGVRHGSSTLSHAHLLEHDGEETDSQRSGEEQGSDTLCDDSGSVTLDVKNLSVDGMPPIQSIRTTVIHPISLPPSSESTPSSTGLAQDRSMPSRSTTVASLPSTTVKTGRNKRKLDELEKDSKVPSQVENRRSSRVPKKRKLN